MEAYVYWFLLALGLLIAEMASGTFYILVLSVAFAVGGLAALLGLSGSLQFVLAAAAGITGIAFLRRSKAARPEEVDNQNLDIGSPVKVIKWNDNGMARVQFRGAEWDAELEAADIPREGTLYIKGMRGSILILTQHKS